jgi:hypothetical protein
MGERVLPAPDAPAEEWGRLAVSLPGPACWDDLEGVDGHDAPGAVCADGTWWSPDSADGMFLDVDHPATAGCLMALLSHGVYAIRLAGLEPDGTSLWQWHDPTPDDAGEHWSAERLTLGRACIAAAAALGRWPGGER